MRAGYIAIGMRRPRDHGHKRVCYALVNRESPTRRLPAFSPTGAPPTTKGHRKTGVLRLLPIADDTATVRPRMLTCPLVSLPPDIAFRKPVRASSRRTRNLEARPVLPFPGRVQAFTFYDTNEWRGEYGHGL